MKISAEEIEWMHKRQREEGASFLILLEGLQVKGEIQAWRLDNDNYFILVKNTNDEFWFVDIDKIIAIQELYHDQSKKSSILRER